MIVVIVIVIVIMIIAIMIILKNLLKALIVRTPTEETPISGNSQLYVRAAASKRDLRMAWRMAKASLHAPPGYRGHMV